MIRKPFRTLSDVKRSWNLIDKVARRAWERDTVDNTSKRAVNNAASEFFGSLVHACNDLKHENSAFTKPNQGVNLEEGNWAELAVHEMSNMVGEIGINSVAQAFLKTMPFLRAIQGTGPTKEGSFLFRGQRDISWSLLPKKARALLENGWTPPINSGLNLENSTYVLPEELDSLRMFQSNWNTLQYIEDADRAIELGNNHPAWWFRMQHYDEGDGTRLLDVTTSLIAALLFACIDWSTGLVDKSADGVIYIWSSGVNFNVDDFLLDTLPDTESKLFCDHPNAPRFILNPPHNERSKAQSGAFLWWPKFWEPIRSQTYYLRVPAGSKMEIVRDLLRMGFGPKDSVRGVDGLRAEQALRDQLGFPPWNPVDLKS